MEQNKKLSNAELSALYFDKAATCVRFCSELSKTLFLGLKNREIPIGLCTLPGAFFSILLFLDCDRAVLSHIGLTNLLNFSFIVFYIAYIPLVTSGFWFWAYIKACRLKFLGLKIQNAFRGIKLENGHAEVPQLIFDKPVDELNRIMRLSKRYLTLEQFNSNSNAIGQGLRMHIESIEESREAGTVDIFYSSVSMPSKFECTDYNRFPHFQFLIGRTRGKEVAGSLLKTPHLLISGESGGGKSSSIRHILTTLSFNNPGTEFSVIDLKDNLEGQIFEGAKNFRVFESHAAALSELQRVRALMKSRYSMLKRAKAKDLEEYEVIRRERSQSPDENTIQLPSLPRHIIAIDEAAQLYLVNKKNSSREVAESREAVSELARMGRALGFHLIIGVQRPDVAALDVHVKSNLSLVLAFKASNNVSSQIILDNARAANLPKIPGRAILKIGGEMTEIQTPHLSVERTHFLLGNEKTPPECKHGTSESTVVRELVPLGIDPRQMEENESKKES